jgi:NTE family protein
MVKARAKAEAARKTATPFESIVLLLQGGGALGAYQAGVYEALAEFDIEPTWIAGISIGAINSAIIAGNAPKDRVAKLRSFWELASADSASWDGWPDWLPGVTDNAALRGFINQLAATGVVWHGVPGFFTPRFPPPVLQPKGSIEAISWYDTSKLRPTLERLVDFDRINDRHMRFCVGAVNVKNGNFIYFDNATDRIGPKHVMASGALPPGFPPIEIDGEYYWDGALVSNTPLDWVLSAPSKLDTLVFQVDLWSASGELPRDLASMAVRMKEIQYSSRTRAATDEFRQRQTYRALFQTLHAKFPADLAATRESKLLDEASDPAAYNIVQLIYHSPTYEGEAKDYEFSRHTMEDHWRAGYRDARRTLSHDEVLRLPGEPAGVQVFDFTRETGEDARVPAESMKDA